MKRLMRRDQSLAMVPRTSYWAARLTSLVRREARRLAVFRGKTPCCAARASLPTATFNAACASATFPAATASLTFRTWPRAVLRR